MNIKPQDLHHFAEEAQLSPEMVREIMYPPRAKRNAKIEREVFIPPVGERSEGSVEKKTKGKSFEWNHQLQTYMDKDFDWQFQINKFFEVLEFERPKVQNTQIIDKSESQQYERAYIQFQPNLKYAQLVKLGCLFYFKVKQAGGFMDVLAYKRLNQIVCLIEQHFDIPRKLYPTELYFQFYKKYLLAFQMFKNGQIKSRQPVDIDKVKYFSPKEIDKIVKEKRQDEEFDRDIFVIENFVKYVGFDQKILCIQYFNEHYGDIRIDTRIQKPKAMGFDVHTNKMFNEQENMKASEYIKYQELEGTPAAKKLPIMKRLKQGQVCFAVNVDLLEKDDIENEIKTKLDKFPFVQYVNDLDVLSYCQNLIPGCNQPQLYFKVKGVYTGGHQENVSMASVNINFGPDDSEWYSIDTVHIDRLRKQVFKEMGIDIINNQGLWFASPEWMITNNYPVKKLIQKKGDLVYSGPGTLHWVRSLGKCYQAAWNLFPKTVKQWNQAILRTNINYEIKFYQIFMPMKSLAIRILNHQYHTRTPFVQAIQKSLKQWVEQECTYVKDYAATNLIDPIRAKYRPLSDTDSLCQRCRHQILTIYYIDSEDETICLKCCSSMKLTRRTFHRKHNIEDIMQLLKNIKKMRETGEIPKDYQMKRLCSTRYCGPVPCSYKNKIIELSSVSLSNKSSHRNSQKERLMDVQMEDQKDKKYHQNSQFHSEVIKKEVNSQINSLRKKQQTFYNEIFVNHNIHRVDPVRLFVMLYQSMPQCSWQSTEEVLRTQMAILQEKGYVPQMTHNKALNIFPQPEPTQLVQPKPINQNQKLPVQRVNTRSSLSRRMGKNEYPNLEQVLANKRLQSKNKNKSVPMDEICEEQVSNASQKQMSKLSIDQSNNSKNIEPNSQSKSNPQNNFVSNKLLQYQTYLPQIQLNPRGQQEQASKVEASFNRNSELSEMDKCLQGSRQIDSVSDQCEQQSKQI